MKKKLLFLLPVLAALMVGCYKTKTQLPQTGLPAGTFVGQFRLLHRSNKSMPYDTAKCDITVTLNADASYFVSGDTSVVHAGSVGTYGISSPYIIFNDNTYPKTGIPAKTHLNGLYQYYYDGTIFQMVGSSADTLSLQYDMKKQ